MGALGAAGHASRGSIGTQRAADVGRYGESSRAGPSVIGKLVCHVKTSPALASKPRGARYLDRGTSRWNSRAPARQGPSPEERHPVYPQRFNWFESTPKNAPRLPIQTNNHATMKPHTHVMSNENKFPLKETTFATTTKRESGHRRVPVAQVALKRTPGARSPVGTVELYTCGA